MYHPITRGLSLRPRDGEILVRFRPGVDRALAEECHRFFGARMLEELADLGVHRVTVPVGREAEVLAGYRQHPHVLYAERNHPVRVLYVPDDPFFVGLYPSTLYGPLDQWNLWAVRGPRAWDALHAAAAEVLVGVVDTGADLSHPDLAGRLAQGGVNLVREGEVPQDDNGHGTHVTGLVAAATDNALGVASISFNRVRVLPVKALDRQGTGDVATVARAVATCAQAGAQVINLSLGSPAYSQVLQDAIHLAVARGCLVVAASGNDGAFQVTYPAGMDGVVGVAASTPWDRAARFSDAGPHVSLAAPGVACLSTMPTYPAYLTEEAGLQTGYDALSGTSMAAPLVSGFLAALRALIPQLRPWALVQRLQRTARPCGRGGWEPRCGYGILDAWGAVSGESTGRDLGGIYGQVVDRHQVAVAGATVTVAGQEQVTGEDGMFRFASLPPDSYVIRAVDGAGRRKVCRAQVVAGADTHARLVLPPAAA